MADEAERVELPDRDPVREYSVEELHALTDNLVEVTTAVHAGHTRGRPLDVDLLCAFHHALFGGVRAHAGRVRTVGRGAETLTFGPNRSVHRNDVEGELRTAFERARESISSLKQNGQDPDYEYAAVHCAAWLHAEIIRIHPFEDGNGRSSRLIMNHVLVELGLEPIPLEAVKQEYRSVLNSYFARRTDLRPLVDLLLRIAGEERPSDSSEG